MVLVDGWLLLHCVMVFKCGLRVYGIGICDTDCCDSFRMVGLIKPLAA